ncbi:MAG TPA: MlaD family protein [Thermoleophilaceae bacterium]|nr:MlaD family protein [Thermoleophilaceae bacterium]
MTMVAVRKHFRDVLAILALAAIGVGVAAYILGQQGARLPLVQEGPFEIEAAFSEAGGVKPGQNQAVRIAGVRVGEISGVELEDGRAIVTLALDKRYGKRVHRDATALLRPRTGLEDMFVELDPGTPAAAPVPEGHRIQIGDTLPDVDSEQILNQLDADTRDYLKLLIAGGGQGLDGRGEDLRGLLKRLEPLHRDLARVQGAFARQRAKLRRLVHNYGQLTTALGRNDEDLERLVTASAEALGGFADQEDDISLAVSRLPGALRATEGALTSVRPFADLLGPTLDRLTPAFAQLDETNAAIRGLARSTTDDVRDDIRPFVRRARPWLADLRPGAAGLAKAAPDLATSLEELNRFFNMAAFNPNGAEPVSGNAAQDRQREEGYLFWAAWLAHASNTLFSTADAQGVFRRSNFAVSCATLRQLVEREPLTAVVLNATTLLADTGLCPTGGGEPLVPLPAVPDLPGLG